jgi:hypothetical protein
MAFPALIKGTFWLDDVKLTLAQTASVDHQTSRHFAHACAPQQPSSARF